MIREDLSEITREVRSEMRSEHNKQGHEHPKQRAHGKSGSNGRDTLTRPIRKNTMGHSEQGGGG